MILQSLKHCIFVYSYRNVSYFIVLNDIFESFREAHCNSVETIQALLAGVAQFWILFLSK